MTTDPTIVLSEGLGLLDELRANHLAAQQKVESVRHGEQARISSSKERVRSIIEAGRDRHNEVVSVAKEQAAKLVAEAKSKADEELDGIRQGVAEEQAAVESQASDAISQALKEAEGPRTEYADGIASLVGTGWATTVSLASYGHRTPKRPKGLHVE
jgi:dsDNA-specific endonuclease/ATPase MutS2